MKIFIISLRRKKKFIYSLPIVLAVLMMVGVTNSNILQVFSGSKLLPVYSVDTPDKKVAITFDCAWGDSDIPVILNELNKKGIKATFFIVGQWAEKYPDTVKAIYSGGHDIGNHSYSHLKMSELGGSKMKSEIFKCSNTLSKLTGNKIDLFRPPYGDYSDGVVAAARDLGCMAIQWDVDSLDWKPDIGREEILSRVVTKVRNGSIILFHNDTPHTSKILPDIITTLKKNGYGFEPLSRLVYRENYIIDFEGRQRRLQQ